MNNTHPTQARPKGLFKHSDLRSPYLGEWHVERTVTRVSGITIVRTTINRHGVCVFVMSTQCLFASQLKPILGLHRRAVATFEDIRRC